MKRFSVVLVDVGQGERMPLLRDDSAGLGVFEPTAFALTLRARGRAVNTLVQALRAVQLLYEMLSSSGVDLMTRIRNNELLTLGEIETVAEQCRLTKSDLDELHHGPRQGQASQIGVAALKKGQRRPTSLKQVHSNTAAIRMTYVCSYLQWLADYAYLQRIPRDREVFREVAARTVSALTQRVPSKKSAGASRRKLGLTHADEARLLALVDPANPANLATSEFLRERNNLIVRMLLGLGLRRGELLGIKVQDINLAKSTVLVARRADDQEDPRRRQPAAKTHARELQIGAALMALVKSYLSSRQRLAGAKRHPYLVVSDEGAPLSLNSITWLFSSLRAELTGMEKLSAHVLRHTWNDRFSAAAEGRLTPDEEKKVRSYLMGWSEKSRSAENYTARYVEQKAHQALAQMQERMFNK